MEWVMKRHTDWLAGTVEVPQKADGLAAPPKTSGVSHLANSGTHFPSHLSEANIGSITALVASMPRLLVTVTEITYLCPAM